MSYLGLNQGCHLLGKRFVELLDVFWSDGSPDLWELLTGEQSAMGYSAIEVTLIAFLMQTHRKASNFSCKLLIKELDLTVSKPMQLNLNGFNWSLSKTIFFIWPGSPSFGPATLLFWHLCILWPHYSWSNGLVISNTTSAHPHATWVAIYLALSRLKA